MAVRFVVHGHFYQPPRENPWTGILDREPSAAPHHDWNERVFLECYRSNAYARILDERGRVLRIVNNYEHMSFNFGPTILSWMEAHHPITYGRILHADAVSRERRGFGNALAQAYNHTILPLDHPRDARTQVRWGLIDFKKRFGRKADGMWLPETAASDDVLAILAEEGVGFTILSPYQAARTRELGSTQWSRVPPRSNRPYRWLHHDGSGRFVDIFFFDAGKAKEVAFERALSTSQRFMDMLAAGTSDVAAIATDGETYGHHFIYGDRTLAHAFEREGPHRGVEFTNYAVVRSESIPTHEVELVEGGSAWSCAHGVGRWSRDCGCSSGGGPGQHQRWRAPLRAALAWLRDQTHEVYEEEASALLADPWDARDAYAEVMHEGPATFEKWSRRFSRKNLSNDDLIRTRTLLEMERQSLLMFTSCAWFHHDVSGIETAQVLKYASRCMDFMEELGRPPVESSFLEALQDAESYIPDEGTGSDVYRRAVSRARVTPKRAVAHIGIESLLEEPANGGRIGGHSFELARFERGQSGPFTLSCGWVKLISESTSRPYQLAFAALHLGGIDFYGTVTDRIGKEAFPELSRNLLDALDESSLPSIVRRMHEIFGPEEFQLTDLLPEGAESLANKVFESLVSRFSEAYANLYRDHGRTLDMLHGAGFKLPAELRAAAEFTLKQRFQEEIARQGQSQDPGAYWHAIEIAQQVTASGYKIDRTEATRVFEHLVNRAVQQAVRTGDEVDAVRGLVDLIRKLALPVRFDQAQETLIGLYGGKPSVRVEQELMDVLGLAPEALGK